MSVKYEDFQSLHEDPNPRNVPGGKSKIGQVMMIGKRIPEPSSGLICFLSAVCTGFIFIIIILIITMTRQGVNQTERSLEMKLRNLSIEVHSRVDQLYVDNFQMMEKLTHFDSFMDEFKKLDVTRKVTNIESLVKFFLSDEITGSLTSDNQWILAAVGRITDKILNKNGTKDSLCDEGWTHYGFNCYYLSRSTRPWEYAKKHCEDKKAHLVVINSVQEMNFLGNISQSQSLWIGLWLENGVWKWVDGTSYEATAKFWEDGEPSSWFTRRHLGCAHMEDGESWKSDFCVTSYQYICEKKEKI
ncbi:asialoglycoprotein receptor 1-like [Pyxicephalus adspersus]|uniref:asialoglycoprotein receptor 1-like n=1 Tax=Pyxicephalus adspersus TaxID=30357 RepID=UPI003B5CBF41